MYIQVFLSNYLLLTIRNLILFFTCSQIFCSTVQISFTVLLCYSVYHQVNLSAVLSLLCYIILVMGRSIRYSQSKMLTFFYFLHFQFWSAYVPCEAQGLDAVQLTLDQVDVIRRLTDLYSEHLILVTTVKGVQEAHRSGKIASLIGIEGGHSLGNSLAVLRSLYNLGARYLTVTHSCDTAW